MLHLLKFNFYNLRSRLCKRSLLPVISLFLMKQKIINCYEKYFSRSTFFTRLLQLVLLCVIIIFIKSFAAKLKYRS